MLSVATYYGSLDIAIAVYVLIQLFQLPAGAAMEDLLPRKEA